MTQRKSSEERASSRAIGRRIRALRGESSQLDFAAAFGLTRAALANYELGRSRPPKELLEKIKERTGLDIDTGPELQDFEDELRGFGGDGARLTEDEWAVVRILRVTLPEDARRVVKELVSCIERHQASVQLADAQFVAMDLARLYVIAGGHADYLRGVSGENLVQIARALADRALQKTQKL
jgi:transcriptional regulator with XRE-family HTH domain